MCQAIYHDEMAQIHAEVSSPENTELPQRSRNARAQARHRAKRKAYIEKLENNVAKLQAILGLTSDQVSDLPPAAVLSNRYAELELENHRLHEQLRALQQILHGRGYGVNSHNGAEWSPDSPTVADFPTQALPINGNDQNYGRDAKKRKISCEEEMPFTDGHHPLVTANDLSTNGLASRAHPLQTSVSHASARGHSADTNTTPFSSTTYNQQHNGPATGPLNPISIKTEPPQFGEMSILASASFLISFFHLFIAHLVHHPLHTSTSEPYPRSPLAHDFS
ncbi:hypothetical protein CPB86DRAFT_704600 [Serendipita vermifera]|nr:hypothetical protein CPB86DRAFT_704600 [Serendipita vermifera]